MVIQADMSPLTIVKDWKNTENVFKKYNLPITDTTLVTLVKEDVLTILLQELNDNVSNLTEACVEGG
ncbi:hypothetical protein [Paenisporosarcina sp. TG20]|uniref:hypothetical protein n=1 Tax=Paenisporosarcina sp. TG20 TaxID=1211706 RepID=UPI0002E247CF|nr:hypothetical protein [Paenisporosarcina sp. TG20]